VGGSARSTSKTRDVHLEYARVATVTDMRHGGPAIVAANAATVLEGSWPSERVVTLEFPSTEAARARYHDPDYQAVIPLRRGAAPSQMVLGEDRQSGD
jgi:uncharacterized protein (DUF1330 family)